MSEQGYCEHCGGDLGRFIGHGDGAEYTGRRHACADNRPWTDAEKVAFHQRIGGPFVPTTQQFAERFGGR